MAINLKDVMEQFAIEEKFFDAEPCQAGHINDTYVVRCENDMVRKFIIQRINTKVFKSPDKLMENIDNVLLHLHRKIAERGGDVKRETLNLIKTRDGKIFLRDSGGECWRCYDFIYGAQTYQVAENPQHLYSAGKAFGNFEKLLMDFDAAKLHETIPNFHNTKKRFDDFIDAIAGDAAKRCDSVQNEIEFVLERGDETSVLVDLLKQGKLPLRVTHNDTKFNNVMIDELTGEGICVIDLDTIMPGSSLYDFGDAIRSGANPAEEDEKDLSKVCIDLNLFEQFTRGFLEATKGILTDTEIEYLAFSAKLITLEMGIRFLADHINGDIYYKIHRENHNLDRARTQFKMVADIESKFDEMKKIVEKYR